MRYWMFRALCVVLTCLLFAVHALAQNLVPNYSFEEHTKCPGSFSRGAGDFRANNWQSANLGTPDHFHSCSTGEADVPHNWAGVSDAYDGHGYAGIYTWVADRVNYREYLQCKLHEVLIKDSIYILEFHYKLSSYSKYSIDRIGLLLTDSALQIQHDKALSVDPTLSVVHDSALTIKTGYWETARMEYIARGGEQYLTIGNFFDNAATKAYLIRHRPIQQSMLEKSAYYYIDKVSVMPRYIPGVDRFVQLIANFPEEGVALNTAYVLRNINFEFNSYRLLSYSFEELDKVILWLQGHPNCKVILSGHTDDIGGERYNLTLSRNRAKAVAAYLVSRGIDAKKIEALGYGKSRPLMEETSEEARLMNRRVEVRFVE